MLNKEYANYTAADFIETVARLKGDVSNQIKLIIDDKVVGVHDLELEATPPLLLLLLCTTIDINTLRTFMSQYIYILVGLRPPARPARQPSFISNSK